MAHPEDRTNIEFALRNCSREAVHAPGAIQPHGALFAVHNDNLTIDHVSENICDFLRVAPRMLLGRHVEEVFARGARARFSRGMRWQASDCATRALGDINFGLRACFVTTVKSGDHTIFELEPPVAGASPELEAEDEIADLWREVHESTSRPALCDRAVEALHRLSGYGRVMVYAFDARGDGRVITERASRGHRPFIGLSFPAWDIPPQARALMEKLPLRVLGDAAADPVPIVAARLDLPDLDQTHGLLRATSPLHRQHLRNMDTRGSLTLSIEIEDRLWGLIALHDREPRYPGPPLRGFCLRFAQAFALRYTALTREAARARLTGLHGAAPAAARDGYSRGASLIDDLRQAMRADGAAVIREGIAEVSGTTPDFASLETLFETAAFGPDLVATSHVAADLPGLARLLPADLAGLLCLRAARGSQIAFFRKAHKRVVLWAGAPEKTVVIDKGAPRLDPRRSFEPFRELQDGGARPWSGEEMRLARALRDVLEGDGVMADFGKDGHRTEGAGTPPVIRALLKALAPAATDIAQAEAGLKETGGAWPDEAGSLPPVILPDRQDRQPRETDGKDWHLGALRVRDSDLLVVPRRRMCLLLTGEADLARAVAAALFAIGFESVDIALGPAEALRALGRALPDLAVLDHAAGAGAGMDRLVARLEAFGVAVAYLADVGAVGHGHVHGAAAINRSLRGYRLRLALAELIR